MTDETKGTETLNSHAKWLRLAADDMGTGEPRHYSWMNTCTDAADEIDRLTALVATEKERADKLELAHSASTLSERRDLTAALQDERERCAKAVCEFCKEGDERTMSNGRLKHIYGRTLFPCKAEPIRSLPPLSGQGVTKTSEPNEQTAALLSEREQVKELREALDLCTNLLSIWKDWTPDYCTANRDFESLPEIQKARAALARSSTQPQMSDSDLTEGGARETERRGVCPACSARYVYCKPCRTLHCACASRQCLHDLTEGGAR